MTSDKLMTNSTVIGKTKTHSVKKLNLLSNQEQPSTFRLQFILLTSVSRVHIIRKARSTRIEIQWHRANLRVRGDRGKKDP